MSASFNEAIEWIALNDDEEAGDPQHPLVSECLVADLFGTSREHVSLCVQRARAYIARRQPIPRMKVRP